ncbi:MAG: ammonium transporter, partial [Myxococcota bacterium]
LAALGVLILWLGWFGFNCGSTVSAEDPAAIGSILLVTNLAASTGFIAALAWAKFRTGTLDFSMALNGALAGLVGITAGCDAIDPLPALAVGVIAAVICVEGVFFFDKRRVDDPVGAISVHGLCGIFGTLAVGLFSRDAGLLMGHGAKQLGIQALGAFAGFGFAFVAAGVIWGAMKAAFPGGIRVSEEHEVEGLDISECGVYAYNIEPLGGFHAVGEDVAQKKSIGVLESASASAS